MDELGNPSLVVILGVLAPFVISALKRPEWPQWAKELLAMGTAVAIGIVAVAVRVEAQETEWSVSVVVGHVATVLLIARGVYLFFLEGGSAPAAKLNARLEALGARPPKG